MDALDGPLRDELAIDDGKPSVVGFHGGIDRVIGDGTETLEGVCCVVATAKESVSWDSGVHEEGVDPVVVVTRS